MLKYEELGRSCHRAGRLGGREGYYIPLKSRQADCGHISTGAAARQALLPLCLF